MAQPSTVQPSQSMASDDERQKYDRIIKGSAMGRLEHPVDTQH